MTQVQVAYNDGSDRLAAFMARMAAISVDQCWEWPYSLTKGYGTQSVNGRRTYTHRLAYERTFGPIPRGLFVCHSCDVPACCNPRHLWLGTNLDNLTDAMDKGRMGRWGQGRKDVRGARCHTAKLTDAQVREIRSRYQAGRGNPNNAPHLAREYGVDRGTLWAVVADKTWTHIE